jgi:hypothetical protein
MASAIRAHAWSRTSLGPLHEWSPALRMVLTTLLECPVPSALIWGPQLISFYNDAYIPLLGNKPFSLGRSFLDIWPEASQVIGPQIEAAFIGDAGRFENVRFMLDRGKGPEEAYVDYSFSPVRNEAGAVVGVLNIATETTSRELAERRRAEADAALAQSEKRFRALVTAGTYSIPHEPRLAGDASTRWSYACKHRGTHRQLARQVHS